MRLSYFLCCLLVLISCKKHKPLLTKITAKTITIDSTIEPSTKIAKIITPYKEKLTTEMQEVLSYTSKDLLKNDGEMQSSLGNLIADVCFDIANPIFKEETSTSIDFVIFNHGGIRASIPKGNVTTEQVFKLIPFENELVVVNITGEKVIGLVDYFIKNKKAHPLSKNIQLAIKENDYSLKINGEAFDKSKNYIVLTSDFLQSGGDNMFFLKNPKKLTKLNYKVRDAIINYFKKVDTLQTTIDNRVIIKL